MSALSVRGMNYVTGQKDLEPTPFADRWQVAFGKLQELLGDDFYEWWDSYPDTVTKGEFLPIMQAKILELSKPKAPHSKGAKHEQGI